LQPFFCFVVDELDVDAVVVVVVDSNDEGRMEAFGAVQN